MRWHTLREAETIILESVVITFIQAASTAPGGNEDSSESSAEIVPAKVSENVA